MRVVARPEHAVDAEPLRGRGEVPFLRFEADVTLAREVLARHQRQPPLDSRKMSRSDGKRSQTPPMSKRPMVTIMSTAFPTACPSAEPPWISSIAMFVTVVFSLILTRPNLRHAPGVSTCTPGWNATGMPSVWHVDQKSSYTWWLNGRSSTYAEGRTNTARMPRDFAYSTSAHARPTSCNGTAATPNRRAGSSEQKSASQSLYARWHAATNSLSCSAGISSSGPKNIARLG